MDLGSSLSFSATTIFDSLPSINKYKRYSIDSNNSLDYSYSLSLSSLTEKDLNSGILTPRPAIEYIYASDILEKIVNHHLMPNNYAYHQNHKASLDSICSGRTKDNVYKLCYNTLKYMTYIDTILVKTQFLVYNNQFLSKLCLLKIMVYDLMRRHFNFAIWPGILYDNVESTTSSKDSLNSNNNNNSSELSIDHSVSESTETIGNPNTTSSPTNTNSNTTSNNNNSNNNKKHNNKKTHKKGSKYDKHSNIKKSREANINGSMDDDLDDIKGLSEENSKLIQKMEAALKAHEVKLAAAFARIRIERKANGNDLTEQLENILPQEVRNKENSASEMPKYFRINTLKQSREQVFNELSKMGYIITKAPNNQENDDQENNKSEMNTVYYDIDLDDVIDVPACNYDNLLNSYLVEESILIPQDKASCLGPHHIYDVLPNNMDIIDTVAGNGTRTSHLAALFKNTRKIYVFEKSLAKAEELKTKFIAQGVKNVEILCTDFLLTDPNDEKFSNVGAIICEPRSIGNAIVDKLGYMMQESEFPNEEYSKKDITLLRKNAENLINHSLKFKSAKTVTFISRTVNKEDNEAIISRILEADNNVDKYELKCVLPKFYNETNYDYEFSECLKLRPNKYRNGIYIACIAQNTLLTNPENENEQEFENGNGNGNEIKKNEGLTKSELALEQNIKMKKKKKLKKKINKNIRNGNSLSSLRETRRIGISDSSMYNLRSNERIANIDNDKDNDNNNNNKNEKEEKEVEEGNNNMNKSISHSTNFIHSKNNSKSKKKLYSSKNSIKSNHNINNNNNSDSVGTLVDMAGHGGNLTKPGAENIDMENLWIYGYSLQRFYAPQYDAMKHMKKSFEHKYPIPNPNPWK